MVALLPRKLPGKFLLLITVAYLTVAVGASASWLAEAKDGGAASARKTPPVPTAECKKDADCALVAEDCCSCTEGGTQRAIAKKQKDAYEKERQKRCAGTMCAQMVSPHPSCSQRAVCAAGLCKLASWVDPAGKARVQSGSKA